MVCGAYWMSSIRSFLNTTLPGVAARFSPTRNGRVSTCRGRPPLLTRSSTKFLAPVATLAPPVSNARLSAAGLVNRKLVGASASSRNPVASRALASSTASPDPAAEQVADQPRGGQVALPDGEEGRVVAPRLVREPLVALGHRDRRRARPCPASGPWPPARPWPRWSRSAAPRRPSRPAAGPRAAAPTCVACAQARRIHRGEHVRLGPQHRGRRLRRLPRCLLCGHSIALRGESCLASDATWRPRTRKDGRVTRPGTCRALFYPALAIWIRDPERSVAA